MHKRISERQQFGRRRSREGNKFLATQQIDHIQENDNQLDGPEKPFDSDREALR